MHAGSGSAHRGGHDTETIHEASGAASPALLEAIVPDERAARRVAIAMLVGTALETYDFMLYGIAASLVFRHSFFVSHDPVVATLGAFATFAVGFAMRPLGAILFGHLGDRIGRRRCLLATILLIGIATALIGLLPDYYSVGVLAPILLTLLRVLQGLAVGGEWGGAMTLAVEHAPVEKRGRYAAMVQQGGPIGMLLGTGAFFLVALLPQDDFDAWGWRLPFLIALPLLAVAFWLRREVEESPLFARMQTHETLAETPVRDVFVKTFPQLVIGSAACFLGIGGYYLASSYVISYGTATLGLPQSLLLAGTMIACIGQIIIVSICSHLGQRFGNARVVVGGGVATILLAFPMFALIDSREPAAVVLGLVIGIAAIYSPLSVVGPLLADLFPADRRYSGLGLSANIAGIFSGFVPLAATKIQATTGGSWSVALLLIGIAAITTVAGLAAPRFSIGRDTAQTPSAAACPAASADLTPTPPSTTISAPVT